MMEVVLVIHSVVLPDVIEFSQPTRQTSGGTLIVPSTIVERSDPRPFGEVKPRSPSGFFFLIFFFFLFFFTWFFGVV